MELRPRTKTPLTPGPEQMQLCKDVTVPVDEEHGTFQNNSVKKEEPDQDPFFCELCRSFFTTECNVHGPPVFVPDTPVPMGVTDRAIQTLPPGLEVRESSIPDAGFGVFNKGDVIPVGVHFGPYQGDAMDSDSSVAACERLQETKSEDARVNKNGNWIRFVNCARNNDEQNLVTFQYQGGILYRCCRPINPGQELLLSHKTESAEDLGVTFGPPNDKQCTDKESNRTLQLISCQLSYTSQDDLESSLMSGPKKRKVDSECRVFKKEWTTKYFFTEVRSKAVCLICQETVAVFKKYNISRHFYTKHANYASNQSTQEKTVTAQRLAARLQAQQNTFTRQTVIQESSTKASYLLAFKLAKTSRPFSEGEFLKECMVETAAILCPESKNKFEKISLSRRTVTRCIRGIDEDLASKLNKQAESFTLYSLALDESNDIKGTAQLLIFIRGINDHFEITEEFLAMESLKGKTRGEDLYNSVSAAMERHKLPWSTLANVTTDGSPNLTGKNVGLLKRIQDRVKEDNPEQEVIFLHCIIHQEALCKSVLQLDHVVKPVVKLVNFIRARGLQHRQFITLLEETDTDHQDLLYHSNVRCLSLGKVCQRVWMLKQEIISFLKLLEKADDFPELSDTDWICDLAFAVDILTHMNELNVKLQGKDGFVHDMYTNVRAFKAKLVLFSKQMSNKSFAHFPTLATLKEAPRHVNKYRTSLDDLHGEFCRRFSDFGKIDESLQLVSCPFTQDPETVAEELQLELIDLQCDAVMKGKFNSLKLEEFYASLSAAKFPNIQKMAQRMLVLFGSTYVCEQTFSVMNINKAPHRSQLSDEHLRSVLRIATTKLTPDFDALAKTGDQQHRPH